MRISRIVVKNFRSLQLVDVPIENLATVVVGENNTGKTNLVHALRICLDVTLSSAFRALTKEDIHSEIDQTKPFQVLIGVEFTDFEGKENEEALLHGTQIGKDRARIFYRFRPKRLVREAIGRGELKDKPIALDDYSWELFGGGNPKVDLPAFEWNHENGDLGATNVSLQHLQSYLVVFLPALRDVEADLQHTRRSPLTRLIEASDISKEEQEKLISAVKAANTQIEKSPTIKAIAGAIDASLKNITGPAFNLDVDLGLSSPSFQAIVRNLILLLSTAHVHQFEPRRNGLGFNNLLYIAMLVEHFQKRAAKGKSAGELILIEEPEAHLHPQLQSTLLDALRSLPFQSIVTTHSTQITAKAPLSSFVALTTRAKKAPLSSVPAKAAALSSDDIHDLERYLDATKSNLLFARRVMLVEGPAELLMIPPLAKKVIGVDLEREGISVVAIHGVHFGPFARLFNPECLPKKCAVVADADLKVPDLPGAAEEDVPQKPDLNALQNDYVKVFLGATTFEREIVDVGNLEMLARTARDLGAVKIEAALRAKQKAGGDPDAAIKDRVLRTAIRYGKGRFAQTATRHVSEAKFLPKYIVDAIAWLRKDD